MESDTIAKAIDSTGPQLINLASFISGDELKGKKSLTSTVEKDHNWADNGVCCFAGAKHNTKQNTKQRFSF